MAQASTTLHEAAEVLGDEVIDRHRAIVSLMEELEAVDWYDQRVHAATDAELRAVLAHNRDEEKEHAVMTLEWLRRRDPALDGHMRAYLFTEGSIAGREEEVESAGAGGSRIAGGGGHGAGAGGSGGGGGDGSLGLGSLRGETEPGGAA
jgi:ferritin-like protein